MKKHSLSISMIAFAAILFLGSCQKENLSSDLNGSGQPSAAGNLKAGKALGTGSSANGQGTLTFNDRFQHFAFHANKSASGISSGSVELHSPGQGTMLHAEVLCLNVFGTEAIVTAQVTRVNDGNPYGIVVGTFLTFKVKDNGEGSKAAPDQFTDAYPMSYQRDCNASFNIPYQDIESGNIQVKQ
jgi:hypothetical protein